MEISENCIDVVKYFENCKFVAYPDPGTGGAPWTIGWGHTGPEVRKGLVWTPDQADNALRSDLAAFVSIVNGALTRTVTQGQFDALVSFCFNVGPGKKGVKDGLLVLKNGNPSSLLKFTNAGQVDKAIGQFQYWNKAAGKPLKGLSRRRKAEELVFGGASAKEAIRVAVATFV